MRAWSICRVCRGRTLAHMVPQTRPLALQSDGFVNGSEKPYWETKSLAQMDAGEWEALCDGCGKCCLNKLEDWDTGAIAFTNVACTLLDGTTCRCRNYENRFATVPDCVQLTPEDVETLPWLPRSCAYRRVAEGKGLPDWHHLVSGDPQAIHRAGASVRGRTISEDEPGADDLEKHLVDWLD